MEGYYSATTFQPEPAPFFGSIVFGSVLYTWIYDNTDRSLLAAIAFHFSGNIAGEVVCPSPELYAYSFLATALVAAGVTLRWGPQTLRRDDERVAMR